MLAQRQRVPNPPLGDAFVQGRFEGDSANGDDLRTMSSCSRTRESLKVLHVAAQEIDGERSVYEERLAAVEALEARRLQLEKLLVKFPKWQSDKEAKECNGCSASFGLFVRRHHCRRCGKGKFFELEISRDLVVTCGVVFCSKCSRKSKRLEQLGYNDPVRHCKKCFEAPAVNTEMVKRELDLLDRIRRKERKTVANPTGERILGLLGCYRRCLSEVQTKRGKAVILNSINCFMEMPNVKKVIEEANHSEDEEETKDASSLI